MEKHVRIAGIVRGRLTVGQEQDSLRHRTVLVARLLRSGGARTPVEPLYDVIDRGKSFNSPHPVQSFMTWLRRWPRKDDRISLSADTHVGLTGSAHLSVGLRQFPNGASVEERLTILADNLQCVHDSVEATRQCARQEAASRAAELRVEREARTSEVNVVSARLKKAMVGGLRLSWFGVVWLLVGVILSTASPELAELAKATR